MLSATGQTNGMQPIQIGIALFQDPETREDLHWALVVHQTNIRGLDPNMYHIRLRPSSGPREWLPAHTTIFGSHNAADRVFPDTGPRPLCHQHSCIGVVHLGMIQISGPSVMRKFHDWITTLSVKHDGNDALGQFYNEHQWCSAGWVLRVVNALETGRGTLAVLGEGNLRLLRDEFSGMQIHMQDLYGRVYGLMGQLKEMKRCSRMRDAVPMLSIWPNHLFPS
ncbi:hypothetical protein BJ165DRAFT_1526344 [Panaeolus papilionaceus]|nr:hypothetical protein BJ165DRAFT_1526344 [Panaeolus papilionaceus]